MKKLTAIILAAGRGTRMKSKLPKVLHKVLGRPLVEYPLQIALKLRCHPAILIVGHEAESIKSRFAGVSSAQFAFQPKQLGSAHAVRMAEKFLQNFTGDVLILSGDVPLLKLETVEKLVALHRSQRNALTLASVRLEDPTGYGRIVRHAGGLVQIIEETDLTAEQKKISEVNGGLYIAQSPLLFEGLRRVKKNPVKQEYYFTDLPSILQQQGQRVGTYLLENSFELLGVNTRFELARAEKIYQQEIVAHWMREGVSFLAPDRVIIQPEVEIGSDTLIHPDVMLLGKTKIGRDCILEQGVLLKDTVLEDGTVLKAYSYLEQSKIGSGAVIGPFARIRPDSILGKKVKIGNFVEVKKSKIGEGSKASHLSYLGDAIIGKNVNIGAGTITCNYDGIAKFKTEIEDEVFIGSDTQLVAPVKLKRGAYIGAGTTVTEDVPSQSLALSRTAQKNILGYAKRKKEKAL